MRWSEQQLEAHKKAHAERKKQSKQRTKEQNHTKVLAVIKSGCVSELERNSEQEEKTILNCIIAAVPPTVNHYWVAAGKTRYLSDRAIAFHSVIGALVPPLMTKARLKLEVTFHFPNRLRRDIDNYLKGTIDSLVKCGLCVDDEQFDEINVKRGEIIEGGLIKLKVTEVEI